KRLLVLPEQGNGDTLLMLRFLPQLKARGAHVILVTKPPLARLVAEAGFTAPRRAVLRPTRRLDATPEALVPEILASPNEPLLSAAGPATIAALSEAVHEALQPFRVGEALVLPQEALLLEARCA
ncbi:MAG: hypothetical protein AAFU72_15250, partial [Pseudomonadota bacterium]